MKRLHYHDEASADLSDAVAWYEAREEGLGDQFYTSIQRTIARIRETPLACAIIDRVRKEAPPRRAVVDDFPYVVVFVAVETEIWVVAISHTARRPRYWRHRL